MIIDALATYLEDNDLGTLSTDLFIGELPLDETDCVSLVLSPSPEPNKSIPYYTQTIDAWARFASYDEGMAKMQAIFDQIHRAENYEMHGFYIYLSYAKGTIDDLDRDAERRHLFKTSFSFVYRVSEESS